MVRWLGEGAGGHAGVCDAGTMTASWSPLPMLWRRIYAGWWVQSWMKYVRYNCQPSLHDEDYAKDILKTSGLLVLPAIPGEKRIAYAIHEWVGGGAEVKKCEDSIYLWWGMILCWTPPTWAWTTGPPLPQILVRRVSTRNQSFDLIEQQNEVNSQLEKINCSPQRDSYEVTRYTMHLIVEGGPKHVWFFDRQLLLWLYM